MTQQLNLCSPILLTKKRYFSALSMIYALGFFVVVLSIVCTYMMIGYKNNAIAVGKTIDSQKKELLTLEEGYKALSVVKKPLTESELINLIKQQRSALKLNGEIVDSLKNKSNNDKYNYSEKFILLSKSIPTDVWLTKIRITSDLIEIDGFTYHPSSINEWINLLNSNNILNIKKLADIKVNKIKDSENTDNKGLEITEKWSFSIRSKLNNSNEIINENKNNE